MTDPSLPFSADSDAFRCFQRLWKEQFREDLTYDQARRHGPKLLALVGSVARWKHSQPVRDRMGKAENAPSPEGAGGQ